MRRRRDTALLVLSSDTSIATLETLLSIGIDGFLAKTSEESAMLDAIRLSCQGLKYKEIAGELGIKYLTVVTITNNIFRKLGINNTVELVLYAIKKELISL